MTTNAETALEDLFEVAGLLTDAMQGELDTRGLTQARAEVVWRLGRDGTMMQRELSQALRCTPRNVTGLLDALEASGLVERHPHPGDRRATRVALTVRGRRAHAVWETGYARMAKALFADASSAELESFVRTLDRLRERLRKMPGNRRRRQPPSA